MGNWGRKKKTQSLTKCVIATVKVYAVEEVKNSYFLQMQT
jgi:hypothetical protein